jgi:hypothetical protein
MVTSEQHAGVASGVEYAKLPPVAEIAVTTFVLVVIGGTYIAAKLPNDVNLTLPFVLAAAASVLLVANIVLTSRLKDFAWDYFYLVARWSLAAYLVTAGMLEYIFIRDRIPDDVMVYLTVMLVIYAVNIPLLFAFSVARYQPPPSRR